MIKGQCRTNLDEYSMEEWPREFAFPPRQGDWVRAKSRRVLTVHKVTHCYGSFGYSKTEDIEVELHK